MEIVIQKTEPKHVDGNIIVEAIENYIERSQFPKGLVAKKLSLKTKEIKKAITEIEEMSDRSQEELNKIIRQTNDLNTKCNSLLYKLRDELIKR